MSTSDHSAVNIDILYAKTSVTVGPDKQDKYKYFQWAQGDYDGMCRYLAERNWNDVFLYCLTADIYGVLFVKYWTMQLIFLYLL